MASNNPIQNPNVGPNLNPNSEQSPNEELSEESDLGDFIEDTASYSTGEPEEVGPIAQSIVTTVQQLTAIGMAASHVNPVTFAWPLQTAAQPSALVPNTESPIIAINSDNDTLNSHTVLSYDISNDNSEPLINSSDDEEEEDDDELDLQSQSDVSVSSSDSGSDLEDNDIINRNQISFGRWSHGCMR